MTTSRFGLLQRFKQFQGLMQYGYMLVKIRQLWVRGTLSRPYTAHPPVSIKFLHLHPMKPEITMRSGTKEDAVIIQTLAEKTWWSTYTKIISDDQIRYMLDTIYSLETLCNAIQAGTQEFILLEENGAPVGFASFSERAEEPGVFKIHKLYVLPETQGKGYGKKLVEEIKRIIATRSSRILDLNVNRYNPAKSFYEKLGFFILREEDIPIGDYWMNDYVMRLEL